MNRTAKRTALYTAGALLVFATGAACGSGGDTDAAPTPAPTVTFTADPGPAPTVTETVMVPTLPDGCAEAFRIADAGFDANAEVLGVTGGIFGDEVPAAIEAAALGDYVTLDDVTDRIVAHTEEISAIGERLDPDGYNAAKAACLDGQG